MSGLEREPESCTRQGRQIARRWRRLGLALSLWGSVWMIPAFSLTIRAAVVQAGALADAGDGESESPEEDPESDAEPFDVVSIRARLGRELSARLAADVALRHPGRCAEREDFSRR